MPIAKVAVSKAKGQKADIIESDAQKAIVVSAINATTVQDNSVTPKSLPNDESKGRRSRLRNSDLRELARKKTTKYKVSAPPQIGVSTITKNRHGK
jgi:hypothetical protein